MTLGFYAFIDASGDEGYNIVPAPERKSSEWFLLSAVICAVDDIPDVNSSIHTSRPFHFRKAQHHRCVAFAARVACLPIIAITVFAHKPSMSADAAIRARKHYLFDYCTKLLRKARLRGWNQRRRAPGTPYQTTEHDPGASAVAPLMHQAA